MHMLINRSSLRCAVLPMVLFCLHALKMLAADTLFSGPQPGEKTTPFKLLDFSLGAESKERDPIAENRGLPTALIFVHQVERSLVPLLRVLDEYGSQRKDRLRTEIVFLYQDRTAGEQRIKAVNGSLKLKSKVGLSLDGAEGPGNYGLNKECLMTVLGVSDNKVVSNFALVQPGIADGPKILAALAKLCGDPAPSSVSDLSPKQPVREAMAPGAREPGRQAPGSPPEDPKLMALLRQFIKPTNDTATVDRVLKDVEAHIRGQAELTRQASNAWTRVLFFGDRYGTAYSREKGRALLERIAAGSYKEK